MELLQNTEMLVSFLNMKMRDGECGLEAVCDDLDWSLSEVEERLAAAGFCYDPAVGRIR